MKQASISYTAISLLLGLTACSLTKPAATAVPSATVPPSPTPWPEPVARSLNVGGAVLIAAEFLDDKHGYAVGNVVGYAAGATMRTEDGGLTWSCQDLILPGCVQFCDLHGLDVVNDNLLWASTDYSNVYYSTDAGKTWNRVTDPGPSGLTLTYISFLDARRGWVGYPSGIFSTEDGGTTWIQLNLPGEIQKIAAIDRPTSTEGYVLDDTGRLHETMDGGKTWTTRDLVLGKKVLVNNEMSAAAMRFPDPRHGVIVLGLVDGGGKIRALRTADGGATWEQTELPVPFGAFHLSNDGLTLARVQSMELTLVSLGGI